MDVQRWDRVQALFEAAKDLDAEARVRMLARSCEGDESLRAEVTAESETLATIAFS